MKDQFLIAEDSDEFLEIEEELARKIVDYVIENISRGSSEAYSEYEYEYPDRK